MDQSPDTAEAGPQRHAFPSYLPPLPPTTTYEPANTDPDLQDSGTTEADSSQKPAYVIQSATVTETDKTDPTPSAPLCAELEIDFDTQLLLEELPQPKLVPLLPEFAKARRRVIKARPIIKSEPEPPSQPPVRRPPPPARRKSPKATKPSPKPTAVSTAPTAGSTLLQPPARPAPATTITPTISTTTAPISSKPPTTTSTITTTAVATTTTPSTHQLAAPSEPKSSSKLATPSISVAPPPASSTFPTVPSTRPGGSGTTQPVSRERTHPLPQAKPGFKLKMSARPEPMAGTKPAGNRFKRAAESMKPLDIKRAKEYKAVVGEDNNTPNTPKLTIKFGGGGSKSAKSATATPTVLETSRPGAEPQRPPKSSLGAPPTKRKKAATPKTKKPIADGKVYSARDVIVFPHPNADSGPWCVCNSFIFTDKDVYIGCTFCEQWYHPEHVNFKPFPALFVCPSCDHKLQVTPGVLRNILDKVKVKKLKRNPAYAMHVSDVQTVFMDAPVTTPYYLQVIENNPMDLRRIYEKLDFTEKGDTKKGYKHISQFCLDINQIIYNCRLYNGGKVPHGNRTPGYQAFYEYADEFGIMIEKEFLANTGRILALPGIPPKPQ